MTSPSVPSPGAMTVHPFPPQDAPDTSFDTTNAVPGAHAAAPESTAYDTVWSEEHTDLPTQDAQGIERIMLADGKIYVVLAVVLVIWFGLLTYLFRTDRKLDRLERRIDADDSTHA